MSLNLATCQEREGQQRARPASVANKQPRTRRQFGRRDGEMAGAAVPKEASDLAGTTRCCP
jgi:hypothetical protein